MKIEINETTLQRNEYNLSEIEHACEVMRNVIDQIERRKRTAYGSRACTDPEIIKEWCTEVRGACIRLIGASRYGIV